MNIFAVIALFNAAICFYLGMYVYHIDKKERLNRIFFHMSMFLGYYAFCEFMRLQAETYERAYLWIKIANPWVFSIPLIVHFSLVFTEKGTILQRRITYVLLYVPWAVLLIVDYIPYFQGTFDVVKKPWGYEYAVNTASFFFHINNLLISLSLLLSLTLLTISSIKTDDNHKKRDARNILIGFLIPIVLRVISGILMTVSKFDLPSLYSVTFTWMIIFFSYSIWRHHLFALTPEKAIHQIINIMPDALFFLDSDGRIVRMNSAAEELLRYPETTMVKKPIGELIAGSKNRDTVVQKMLKGETITHHELIFEGRNHHTRIPVIFSSRGIYTPNKKIAGTVCMATDVSQLKEMEKRLLKSNQELQDFASIASHDLQEPLRKVKAFSDRMKDKYASVLDERGSHYIERIEDAVKRMQRLIEGLLSYSRVTTKAQPFEEVDLNAVVQEVVSDLEIRIKEAQGKVITHALPVIEADPLQMHQLFQNLLGNALKYRHRLRAPVVEIESKLVKRNSYEITISDNGIGFDEKYANNIFGIFQRLVRKEEFEGSGIGLAICKKIVERHRGIIWARSQPEQGTIFSVTLPKSGN